MRHRGYDPDIERADRVFSVLDISRPRPARLSEEDFRYAVENRMWPRPVSRPYAWTHPHLKQRAQERKRARAMRERLPTDREGTTLRFVIVSRDENNPLDDAPPIEVHGYLTANTYPDGRLAEIFVKVGKAGSSSAMYDEWAKCFSLALQHGVPLETLCSLSRHTNFLPAGPTNVPGVPRCSSVTDLVCAWLSARFASNAREK